MLWHKTRKLLQIRCYFDVCIAKLLCIFLLFFDLLDTDVVWCFYIITLFLCYHEVNVQILQFYIPTVHIATRRLLLQTLTYTLIYLIVRWLRRYSLLLYWQPVFQIKNLEICHTKYDWGKDWDQDNFLGFGVVLPYVRRA